MKKKISFLIITVFVIFALNASVANASYQYFFSIANEVVQSHLKVYFWIPASATRIDKCCLVNTSYSNHGSISNWDLSLCKTSHGILATLLVPKSFWLTTWYGKVGYGVELASQLVYLGVRY